MKQNRLNRAWQAVKAARANGSKGASPLSGPLARKRRLIELCRPPRALPSRMRDRGGDIVPPDVRFAGKCPVVTRAPPWTKAETVTAPKNLMWTAPEAKSPIHILTCFAEAPHSVRPEAPDKRTVDGM